VQRTVDESARWQGLADDLALLALWSSWVDQVWLDGHLPGVC